MHAHYPVTHLKEVGVSASLHTLKHGGVGEAER